MSVGYMSLASRVRIPPHIAALTLPHAPSSTARQQEGAQPSIYHGASVPPLGESPPSPPLPLPLQPPPPALQPLRHRHVRFQKPPPSLAVTAAADINTASTDANATTSAAAPRRNCHSQLHLPITVFYYHIHHTTHTMQLAPTTVPLLLTHHQPHPPQRRRQPRRKLARQQHRPRRRVGHLT